MASTYPSVAVLLNYESVPEVLDSPTEIYNLLDIGQKQNDTLGGASRHGWLGWIIERISKKYGLDSLNFLYCEPWNSPDGCYATILKSGEIDSAVNAIQFLLARFESHPQELIELDDGGGWTAEALLKELQESRPSLSPKNDDGQALNYLFAYLKSFLVFCEKAHVNNFAVLYAQFDA